MKRGKKILVVDDEADILNLLDYNLRKAGFRVFTAKDGPEALELAEKSLPDLILLDIMLPDMDGLEVLRRLKAGPATCAVPVIMLTAKGEEVDRVVGFELGAEDYITKPFSPRELTLRAKAVLKRASHPPPEKVCREKVASYRELTVDLLRHRVKVGGRAVDLSSKEFGLLVELIGSKGRVLSRDSILDRVWGAECYVTPRTVDTHIRRLRAKLRGAGEYIETVRGAGYRFKEE